VGLVLSEPVQDLIRRRTIFKERAQPVVLFRNTRRPGVPQVGNQFIPSRGAARQ
jgi:hypothetical protein